MTDPNKVKPKQDVNYNHQDEDIDWLDQSIRDDYHKKRPDWLGGTETEDEFWSHTE